MMMMSDEESKHHIFVDFLRFSLFSCFKLPLSGLVVVIVPLLGLLWTIVVVVVIGFAS